MGPGVRRRMGGEGKGRNNKEGEERKGMEGRLPHLKFKSGYALVF